MSDIFKDDVNELTNDDIFSLEDDNIDDNTARTNAGNYVFPTPLYCLKLEYSSETVYATAPETMELKAGDAVIIPTRYGKDMAIVLGISKNPQGIQPADIIAVDRKASTDDISRAKEFAEREKEAFQTFKEKAIARKLDMKAIGVHFLLEEQKVVFFFSADNRVDFRELVKDLVGIFKMRIELRQIGVRDESRIVGGLGVCGRPFCCNAVSDKLRPVSIKMAKVQNLSLNSIKISGQCGRLLCCLAYESDWYNEARKRMPSEGVRIFFDGTSFRITELNQIRGTVKLIGEDGRILDLPAERFAYAGGKWKILKES
ncbi:MAG: regulatory iron-sulfur-containing complex subunit RicT [Spirochaetales bacterium]